MACFSHTIKRLKQFVKATRLICTSPHLLEHILEAAPFSCYLAHMAVCVCTLAGESIFEIQAETCATVGDLKASLQKARGVPTCRQQVLFRDAALDDDCCLATLAPAHLGFVALAFDESDEAVKALEDACVAADPLEVRRLLRLPTNPNAPKWPCPPLFRAICKQPNSSEVVHLLLGAWADPNAEGVVSDGDDPWTATPLHLTAGLQARTEAATIAQALCCAKANLD